MSNHEKLLKIRENMTGDTLNKMHEIREDMEEQIGAAEMWKTVVLGFSYDELLENLIFISHEHDL